MRLCCLLGGVFLGIAPGLCLAQSGAWTKGIQGQVHPVSRFGAAFVYDPARDNMVMFGGLCASPGGPLTLDDTWTTTTGKDWTQAQPAAHPGPRFGPAAVFDKLNQQTVVYGGAVFVNNGVIFSLDDTWVWDGTAWTAKNPATKPVARYFPGSAYDEPRNQTVMFGGVNSYGYLGDTWVWDGSNWVQKFPAHAPSARSGANVTYDSVRKVVVLFGGVNLSGSQADTWTWDGNDWIQKFPAHSPPARYGAGFAFHKAQLQAVLFAGTNEVGNLNDTWIWGGTDWGQRVTDPTPTSRFYTHMTYNDRYGKIALWGGGKGSFIGDIYLFDLWTWQ